MVLSHCSTDGISLWPVFRKPFDMILIEQEQKNGAPGEIRTPDPLVRSQMLYPAELRARAAILPKFAGGAAEGEFLDAAHGTKFDGARHQAWVPGRAMWKRRPATEKFKRAA